VRHHVALAQEFAGWVKASAEFELAAPAPLNLVAFRHRGGDDINRRLLERLNAGGRIYLSHAVLGGRYALRMSIGQTRVERRHVAAAWDRIRETASVVAAEAGSG
jgi:aromatic-L-amino-acid decarboxylase